MSRLLLILTLLLFPAAPQPRLIAMGDSITVGLGASAPDRAWAAMVAQQTGRELINVAISGIRVDQQPIPTVQPGDLVIWLVGYNDMRQGTPLAAYQATIAAGVAQLQSQGARVVLASGLRMTPAGYACCGAAWGHGSDDAARAYTVAGVDLGGLVPSPTDDQIHPNDAGHTAIAQAILAGLAPLAASWSSDVLQVQSAPGCLYLIGNHRPTQWIGCNESIYTLPPGNVDQDRAPMGRTLVLADATTGQEIARLVVPPRIVVWFPLMAMP